MEHYEDRILAGILRSGNATSLESAQGLLARDLHIIAPAERTTINDLWPCIWALCACLERQFSGTIHINCGRTTPLRQPAALSTRCSFGTNPSEECLRIYLGTAPSRQGNNSLWGDARANSISHEAILDGQSPAHPAASFALAGYLGFAALANAVGIPPYRAQYCQSKLHLLPIGPHNMLPDELTIIGLGQLGQAYLALLYFLTAETRQDLTLHLIDKDHFEGPNQRTQVLLEESGEWNGKEKASYLESFTRAWGWKATGEISTIDWGWQRAPQHPSVALLGLDDLDVRRMAIAAHYEWIIDSGLGTSFTTPRLSWHSVPPDNELARKLFIAARTDEHTPLENTAFHTQLLDTPGQCGWVTFKNITAAAPSMGLAAAAYAIAELLNGRQAISGRASLWSTLLPFHREVLIP